MLKRLGSRNLSDLTMPWIGTHFCCTHVQYFKTMHYNLSTHVGKFCFLLSSFSFAWDVTGFSLCCRGHRATILQFKHLKELIERAKVILYSPLSTILVSALVWLFLIPVNTGLNRMSKVNGKMCLWTMMMFSQPLMDLIAI